MYSPMATALDSPQRFSSQWLLSRQPFDWSKIQEGLTTPNSQPFFAPGLTMEQLRSNGSAAPRLRALQFDYTILGDERLIGGILSERPSLYPLLQEATKPLHQAFGEKCILQLRALASDEESMLNAVVQLSLDFEDPEGALRSFDEAWWLGNCHRSGGALVFDYEIRDAF